MALYVVTLLVTTPPGEAGDAVRRHRERLARLRAEGRLRFAVELAGGEGFVEVLEVADLLEADEVARSSPLVEDGLCAWLIRACAEPELGP